MALPRAAIALVVSALACGGFASEAAARPSRDRATSSTPSGSVVAPSAGAVTASFTPIPGVDGLVTNEWAYWNPSLASAKMSPDWEMTSGSLFARSGSYWTGKPDDKVPDARSTTGTDSAIFRLTSRRRDLTDVTVTMDLRMVALVSTPSTPPVAWDGVHLFLRYQDEQNLYYASVARRDGHVVLKKKCAGGSSNGGTYVTLADVGGAALPLNTWRSVGATVRNLSDGSVALTVQRGGRTILSAVDRGGLCGPIRLGGAVGVRGDNAEANFGAFSARPL